MEDYMYTDRKNNLRKMKKNTKLSGRPEGYRFLGLTLRFAVALAITVQSTSGAGATLKLLAAQYSSVAACALLVTVLCHPRIPNL